MKTRTILNNGLKLVAIAFTIGFYLSADAVIWSNIPAAASSVSAPPMTMLVATKDHKLFYEAYNDASDLDGDGVVDTRFKPSITYYGLFDSTYCYTYSTTNLRFVPAALTDSLGRCTNNARPWSGNWLNYMTTSRIDALRKVLYGGYREVDSTNATVLRRAYIPQDAHSWGKEYHSVATDGYDIADYTPLVAPTLATRRHFFGNLTDNHVTNCDVLNNCSNLPPLLRIRENVGDDRRIWEWASKERPVLHDSLSSGAFPTDTGAARNFQVRVVVCTAAFNAGCRQYPNGGSPVYKPVGLLHEYGENGSMLFGLMTGSYDRHMSGGRLRKTVSSFADEVNSTTGQFNAAAPIVNTFDRLRIRGFNQGRTDQAYGEGDPFDRGSRAPIEGQFVDWGNPVGEMLYEATRYFAGRRAPTTDFMGPTTIDEQVGLTSATWDDPYASDSAASAAQCAKPSFLTISDINPSFDSDTVPGHHPFRIGATTIPTFTGDLTGLNVVTRAGNITAIESNITGLRFIGQSGDLYDAAPTAKNVTSLGTIRGLAPDEPAKQGSYYSAAVAYHARTTDLRTLTGVQSIDNYVVALSSPLPKIEVPMAGGRIITLVPFAKTVNSAGGTTRGNYQPTNQIVDFYVETIVNAGTGTFNASVNGGRYQAIFNINFEDMEQGGDHDMDAIARYVVRANADNTVSVAVVPTYQAGGFQQHMGYVISGSNRDGVYLVARDETNSPAYFLNVPPGRFAGHCEATPMPADCANLPGIGGVIPTFTFTPSAAATSASILKSPLWYAAKYGGFKDRNGSNTPDLPLEWDENNDGVPDTYFLVQNPLNLRESLRRAFDEILVRDGSGGNVIANSTSANADTLVYQASFDSRNWSGELRAFPVGSDTGVGSIATWRASENIPATRRILYKGDDGTGKMFQWANLSVAERGLLGTSSVLDYIRGSRAGEIRNSGTFRNRDETNVLGDIAHSSPAFLRDNRTVFIGANDGMLHAFDSATGLERFAFIPSSSIPRLVSLTNPGYNERHQYYVDGDIVVSSSAQTGTTNYLVSTLGRGEKGLFGLNVTSPSTFSGADVLWEYDSSSADPDLGYMLGRPVLARMQNGQWAVIVGNGYNSTNRRAVLYVFNLATGALIRKLDTGVAGDNGLATPGVRFDSAGRAVSAYAGDLRGNVWEFDLSSTSSAAWVIANSGNPFFTATDGAGNPQPITAPITMAVNDVPEDPHYNRLFVYVGTGSDFQVGDPSSTQTQTWYGLIDTGTAIGSRNDLRARTVLLTGDRNERPVRTFAAATEGDMVGMRGFRVDLPESGERIVTASNYYRLAEPVLIASSIIPVANLCEPGGRGYINAIGAFSGARLTRPFFDVNDDGRFTDDVLNGVFVGSVDLGIGKPGESILVGNRLVVGGSRGVIEDIRINRGVTPVSGRLSWREIVRD